MAKKRIIELTIEGYTFSMKNLKVHEDMSEETTCFSAELMCNGKLIAHCSNEGRGGCTSVYPGPNLELYKDAMKAVSTVRDTEYEKKIDEFMSKCKDHQPCVIYYTPEHLADAIMYKQDEWDQVLPQLKRFAKKHPGYTIWFDGSTISARKGEDLSSQGYEDITQYVR